jgi:hypothetical protein
MVERGLFHESGDSSATIRGMHLSLLVWGVENISWGCVPYFNQGE